MTVEKVVENGMTYRVESDGTNVVKMKVEPILRYGDVPSKVNSGDVVTIPMHLEDFDGAPRHDDAQVTFLIGDELVPMPMTGGNVTLELELVTRGRLRIAAIPLNATMTPFEIEVA